MKNAAPVMAHGNGRGTKSNAIIAYEKGKVNMYNDVYVWNVIDEIAKGRLVCVTDRQKGENYFCNGMIVSVLVELIKSAKDDDTNRYQFYYYSEKEAE